MEPVLASSGLTPRDFSITPRDERSLVRMTSSQSLLSARKRAPSDPDVTEVWLQTPMVNVPATSPRRRFVYDKDKALPDQKEEKEAMRCFEKASSCTALQTELNDKSQKVYQREAQVGEVRTSHEAFAKSLKRTFRQVEESWKDAANKFDVITLLQDAKNIATALVSMIALDTITGPLISKKDELCDLLKSPEHQEALEFYKAEKRDCRALKENTDVQAAVDELSSILRRTEAKFEEKQKILPGKDSIISQQSAALYEELLSNINYMATYIAEYMPPEPISWGWTITGYGYLWGQKPLPRKRSEEDAAPIRALMAPLVQRIQAISGKLTGLVAPDHREKVPDTQSLEAAKGYIVTCSHDTLDAADDFRNGKVIQNSSRGPYRELLVSYNPVTLQQEPGPVRRLQDIAKCLARLQKTATTRLHEICEGNTTSPFASFTEESAHYENLLHSLKALIKEQHAVIDNLPPTNRKHAALYYEARLLRKANDVHLALSQFKKLSQPDFISYAHAVRQVVVFLDPARAAPVADNASGTVFAIDRLFKALVATQNLQRPDAQVHFSQRLRSKIYDTLDEILAVRGSKLLELTPEEQQIPTKLLLEAPLETFYRPGDAQLVTLPPAILTYLLKGFLNKLYFLPENSVDLDFEISLFILENDPCYSPAFNQTKTSAHFSHYYDSYHSCTDMKKYVEEFTAITRILALVKKPDKSNMENYFAYCQVRQRLDELRKMSAQPHSQLQLSRLHLLHTQIDAYFKESEVFFDLYYRDFDTIDTTIKQESSLFKSFVQSLYSQNVEQKKHARTRVIELLPLYDDYSSLLFTLKGAWMLEQLMLKSVDDIPDHEKFLSTLLEEYLRNPDKMYMWRQIYGIAFMESALYTFITKSSTFTHDIEFVIRAAKQNRDNNQYNAWKETLKLYISCTEDLRLNREAILDSSRDCNQLTANLKEMKVLFGQNPIEVPQDHLESTTHLGVMRWCFTDMLSQYIVLRYEQYSRLLNKNPNRKLIIGSEEHKAASSISTDLEKVFGQDIPIEENPVLAHPNLHEARKMRMEMALSFNLDSQKA
ncbi:MAG: hypothetical protein LLF94_01735 [Chlamydiales bacterium]|nr:hypothetical protein [Chlamydiales bacterium]